MRILINGLSATSYAGEHVLSGLVRHLASSAPEECLWLVLSPGRALTHLADSKAGIEVLSCPGSEMRWPDRTLWELRHVPGLAMRWRADYVVAYSGVCLPRIKVPQICLACNPRPLVHVPFLDGEQFVKHRLQRLLYRWSMSRAALTVFNSDHLLRLHRRNGSGSAVRAIVVPHGLSEQLFAAAGAKIADDHRRPFDIASVSVWSPYKDAETLVHAVAMLQHEFGVPARLTLAGPWPSMPYRRRVTALIGQLHLADSVRITGYLETQALYALYRSSRVFCLPSLTESFGLPALEAQAFGTPVIGSSTTAMPEVCGEGGLYCEPGHPRQLAGLLRLVLTDRPRWEELSAAARRNAGRYRWDRCVRPLRRLLERRVDPGSSVVVAGPSGDGAAVREQLVEGPV